MKKSCKVTKHPCKICFQSVTKKNGVQCQGVCRKWVHFECLNYTPGKIKDIKAGHIKIMCPCPDCTTEPKEIRINPPFTCKNEKCPANSMPKCESEDCPVNEGMVCGKELCSKNINYADERQSEYDSRQNNPPQYRPQQQYPSEYCPPDYRPPQYGPPQYFPPKGGPQMYLPPQSGPPQFASPKGVTAPCGSPKYNPNSPYGSSHNLKPGREGCATCSSGAVMRTDSKTRLPEPSESNCSIVVRPPSMKSKSCCCVTKCAGPTNNQFHPTQPPKLALSDSRFSFGNKSNGSNNNRFERSMECALEQMCNTVGLLSHQIRDLMCKIMDKAR